MRLRSPYYGEMAIGMVLMIKKEKGFWDDRDMRKLLLVYAGLASSALYRVRLMEFTKHAAITDALTDVYNRRFFEDMFEKQLALTISIGVSSFPSHETECSALLRSADKALYRAKEKSRGKVEVSYVID